MKAILIILIIIIIFIITSKCLIENFTIFHNNTNNLHKSFYKSIDSNYKPHYYIDSIPDNNLNYLNCNLDYVELNNKDYKNKLVKIFNIENNINNIIHITENIKWSNWITTTNTSDYYKIYFKFIKYIYTILKDYNINIITDVLKFVKYDLNNNNNLLLNLDLLLYTKNKLFGKHINFIIFYNNDFHIIYFNIIGNVSNYNINNNLYLKDVNNSNSFTITSFNNDNIDCLTCDNHISIKDEYIHDNINKILLENILDEGYLDKDYEDIKKNKEYKYNENILKNYFMNKIYTKTNIIPYNYY
jgi:hypothetical protein